MRPPRLDSDSPPAPCRSGYESFRAALRQLDKYRADDIWLAIRTHRTRKRIMRRALIAINLARAAMDDAIVDDRRDLDAEPRGMRTRYNAAATDYDRLYHAYGWMRSSAKQLGRARSVTPDQLVENRALSDQLAGAVERKLYALSCKLPRPRRGDGA